MFGQHFGALGHGCANSFEADGAILSSTGVSSIARDDLILRAEGLPSTAPVLFFQGTVSGGAGVAFGDGLRCVQGSIRRLKWYRNSATFCGPDSFNLTNGIEVTWDQ